MPALITQSSQVAGGIFLWPASHICQALSVTCTESAASCCVSPRLALRVRIFLGLGGGNMNSFCEHCSL